MNEYSKVMGAIYTYISIIKELTWAERINDWEGYLPTIGKMLNLFAATGHID